MTDLETTIVKKISDILPRLEKLEFRANIGDRGHSVEFYATLDGKRMQCHDMVDAGMINESQLAKVCREIADCVRSTDVFRPGEINKISFVVSR